MKKIRAIKLWLPVAISILIGIGVFLTLFWVRTAGYLQLLELKSYDGLLKSQPHDDSMASKIVIVGITEDDLHDPKNGVGYPVPDDMMARMLQQLLDMKPRAIGVDIFRDLQVPAPAEGQDKTPQRQKLEQVWKANSNLVFVWKMASADGHDSTLWPAGLPDRQAGFADYIVDSDGVFRRAELFDLAKNPQTGEEFRATAFAARLASLYLRKENPPIGFRPVPPNPDDVSLGKTVFHTLEDFDGGYVRVGTGGLQYLLDWKSPSPSSFKHFSVAQLRSGEVKQPDIEGKIILVGMTAPSLKDLLLNPGTGEYNYGVEVHASSISQLLRAALAGTGTVHFWPEWRESVWMFAWAMAGVTVGFRVRSPGIFIIVVLLGIGALFGTAYLAFVYRWWIPFVPPLLGWSLSAFLVTSYVSYREKADRVLVMQLFSRHVSRDVADTIWQERDQFLKKGRIAAQPLTATVIFTDLKGFSGVSETMSPQQLMEWLNELMDALSQVVDRNGGIVNKYIGDAVMAVFGVPVPRTTREGQARDAANAVRCAQEMRKTLARLNPQWEQRGLPKIGMRIGVFTGPLVAGSLGSAERMEYTVIGDTVNTAARLESFDKAVMDPDITADGCRILIGESTHALLDGAFLTRYIGIMPIPGKQDKVAIHGVIGPA